MKANGIKILAGWVLAAGLGFAVSSCSSSGDQADAAATEDPATETAQASDTESGTKVDTVVIEKMAFNPQHLTIHAGDKVVWVNKGIVAHNVTDSLGAWGSGDFEPGQTWETTPTEDLHYYCTIHPTMRGSVTIVQE